MVGDSLYLMLRICGRVIGDVQKHTIMSLMKLLVHYLNKIEIPISIYDPLFIDLIFVWTNIALKPACMIAERIQHFWGQEGV